MLAIREIDDDWWEEPNCGSISVNSYGQLKLEDIIKIIKLFFRTSNESKIKM